MECSEEGRNTEKKQKGNTKLRNKEGGWRNEVINEEGREKGEKKERKGE